MTNQPLQYIPGDVNLTMRTVRKRYRAWLLSAEALALAEAGAVPSLRQWVRHYPGALARVSSTVLSPTLARVLRSRPS